MDTNIYNELNTIQYHHNQIDYYRRQLWETGRNMQIDDDVLEDMLENNFDDVPITLRQYYALIVIHMSIYYLLGHIRDTNGVGNHDRFYDRIHRNIIQYLEDLNQDFVNIVVQWMNYHRNTTNV